MDSKNELKELTLLFDISIALNKSKNIKDVLYQILEMMAKYIGLERGTITLLNKDSLEISIEEAYGMSKEEKARGKYKVGEGIIGKVVKSGMSVYIPRISDEPQFMDKTKSRNSINKEDVSYLCVPIKHEKEVIGTLSVDRVFNNNFSFEEDIRLITIIGSMIAQALKARQEELEEVQRLQEENKRLQSELKMKFSPATMIGNGQAMQVVYNLISKVAPTTANVLITGESGVGKELVAKSIHFNSQRASQAFEEINCSGLTEAMIETELFGSVAQDSEGHDQVTIGIFERSHYGSVFLTDLADVPLNIQSKILQLIEDKQLQRVGSQDKIDVDIRLIAATSKNPDRLLEEGKLLNPLYYLFNVFPIHIPPLRERKSDIPQLIDHFIVKFNDQHGLNVRRISTSAIDMIMSYHWPGNVRELENCLERACILSNSGVIYGFHLPPTLQTPESSGPPERGPLQTVLAKVEKELIQDNLKLTKGDIGQAADNLGITERQMEMRIANYNINIKKYKLKNI
ncbi:MAG: sigma 54-interacting transcriptional regulator [Cyclobacteriaceae bacterium]|nr:sigma 54-interacting transcriptional regulator [Cyclobacteriaceae bacterium]